MAEVTQLIHHCLRHNKKFPHVLCPGCGHDEERYAMMRTRLQGSAS